MKWLLVFFARILLGLVLACAVYLIMFRIWMEAGCFRWDPGAGWWPPSHCGFLSGVFRVVSWITFGSALLFPLYLLGKENR
jgi:hypothetical protein